MKSLILFLTLVVSAPLVWGQDMNDRMGTLGGNKDLVRKARALDPNNRVRIVQKRAVDRTWRFELGVNYGPVSNGDPYLNTAAVGGMIDLHVNPYFSIGGRYYDYQNELSPEGKRVFQDAANRDAGGDPWGKPAVDYPLNAALATVTFYPLYGKLNLFDMGVAQFDLYMVGGYGQMKLSSGSTPAWTAGGGVGMWLSQHLSTRVEVRYQNFEDKISSGTRDENVIATTFAIGILL